MSKNTSVKTNNKAPNRPKKVSKPKSAALSLPPRNVLLWIIVIVVAAVAVFGIADRHNIALKYHKVRYGMDVRHGFNQEFAALNEPLSAFGITKSPKSTCTLESFYDYSSPQQFCTAMEQPYTVIGRSTVLKAHYVAEATLLDQLLAENGWTENHNAAPTYKAWMQAITSGKDWYPDEGAYKNFGNEHCWMDVFLAYANPSPPAFTMHYGCDAPALQKYLTLPF